MATKIDARIYRGVKRLQECGTPAAEAAEYMMITPPQAGMIYKSESFEDFTSTVYLGIQKAREAKSKKNDDKKVEECKPQEVRHTVEIQATHFMMEEMRKQTKLLELISNKMAFIVDELTK